MNDIFLYKCKLKYDIKTLIRHERTEHADIYIETPFVTDGPVHLNMLC